MKLGGGYSSKNMSNQFENQSTTSGTATSDTSANKLPEQLQTAPDIFATLHRYLMDPQAAVNPARMAGRAQVNQNYSGLADRVRQRFLTTGGGGSGKSGQAILAGETGRAGALADVDMAAQQQAAALPLTAAQLAEAFLGINMGSKTNTSGAQTTSSSGTGSGHESGWGINGSASFSPGGGGGGGGGGSYTGLE